MFIPSDGTIKTSKERDSRANNQEQILGSRELRLGLCCGVIPRRRVNRRKVSVRFLGDYEVFDREVGEVGCSENPHTFSEDD